MTDLWDELRGRPLALVGLAALMVSYPVLLLAALIPAAWLFGVTLVVSYAAETYAVRTAPQLVQILSRVSLGVTLRFLLRESMLLVLLARISVDEVGTTTFVVLTVGLMALHAIRAMHAGLTLFTTRRRRLPVVTRRFDLGRLNIPDAPPRLVVDNSVRKMLTLDIAPLTGAVIGAFTGLYALAIVGVAVALVLAAAATAVMAHHARLARSLPGEERILREVNARIKKDRTEVVLYFSGSLDSAYQVNMWLSTMEQLRRRALVIVRERGLVPLLERTSVPVLCVPQAINLMKLEMPDVRVALFSANAAKNVHMLRIPGIRHVFVNHGDSDKASSFNPYSKVYDEVWVAGKAGRDRYRRARTGVRDEDIVEVGRPQLAPIARQDQCPNTPMRTVLYAPTWEGYNNDPFHTSIALMGETIVRALLDHSPALRVIYKPHPLTGHIDPKARRAHERITAMMEEANRARDASGQWRHNSDDDAARRARAEARLPELERQLASHTRGSTAGNTDEAQTSRDSGKSGGEAEQEVQRLQQEWKAAYWDAQGWWRHRVITGTMPHLYDCFNASDLLISDISSVVADFIASQKPYVVTNAAELDETTFRAQYPTAAAGFLLGRDCADLPEILAEVADSGTDGGEDSMARRRQALATYLLGPDEPDAMTRFNDAIDAAVETSAAQPPPPEDLEVPFDPEPEPDAGEEPPHEREEASPEAVQASEVEAETEDGAEAEAEAGAGTGTEPDDQEKESIR